jgi:hypothetical protein
LWIVPLYIGGAIAVVVNLKNASSSGTKVAMMVFAVLTPLLLAGLIVGVIPRRGPNFGRESGIIGGVLGPLYLLSGSLFVLFADMTFRSMHGIAARLSSPRYLRSVHLGLNIAALVCMPLCLFVGVPLVLHRLRTISSRPSSPGFFAWSFIFGIVALVSLLATLNPRSWLYALAPCVFAHVGFICVADVLILRAIFDEEESVPLPPMTATTTKCERKTATLHEDASGSESKDAPDAPDTPSPHASKYANFSKIDSASEFKSIR